MKIVKDHKFIEFFEGIKDEKTKGVIAARIARLSLGAFGNSESVGEGVQELKIDFGPGWRVYYIKVAETMIVLLGGGSKNGQQKDIDAAKDRVRTLKKK
ncbi:type II toxin-antitoxin system RelE/ParE family toxin [Duganella sp. FT109W]|uniref:Type II toxin-antitoxin system RelE/ParE family toxin n=1 Tax=Duganella margarita TaxID=2692170 RepID=A0ABW9WAA4_9BURK|nr:type II toxin-antitoxin system RelE/ParE family toxin [Duganella margarita]MYN37992.1 type II toxin-antitoxin system RelE/ParE family toxin [Duganella margarita]